jgi:hypothetical protein
LHVGRVDDRQLSRGESLGSYVMQHFKSVLVAAWLFSSSETRPRQKSEDNTSVGLKCLRANVDLPQPEGPTRTTSDSSGIVIVLKTRYSLLKIASCVGAPKAVSSGPTGRKRTA